MKGEKTEQQRMEDHALNENLSFLSFLSHIFRASVSLLVT